MVDPRWVSPGGVAPRPSDFSPARLGLRLSLYRDVAAITCNKRDLPRFPEQLPSHPVPTTPESPPASSRLFSADGCGLPHLTTGSALSINKLRGSMGSLVVRAASLRGFPLEVFSTAQP